MTQEQLAQIEARAATAHGFVDEEYEHRSYAYSGDDPYVAVARQARDAARALDEVDIPALVAHIRKLEAVRLRRRSAKRSKIEAMGGGEG